MKILSILGIAAVLAFASVSSSFATDAAPTTKDECEKAGMKWDEAHGKCEKQ